MKKKALIISGILGASGIALGALGAHWLKQQAISGIITFDNLESFNTGVKFQIYHALAILAIGGYEAENLFKAIKWMVAGTILFSGSVYLLSLKNILGITSLSILGPITPLGGIILIFSWILLAFYAYKHNFSTK